MALKDVFSKKNNNKFEQKIFKHLEELVNKKYQALESKHTEQILKLTEQLCKSMFNDLLKHGSSPFSQASKTHHSFAFDGLTSELATIIEKIIK